MGITFVSVGPETNSRTAERIAKSHAAKERHGKIRRKRMLEYQSARISDENHHTGLCEKASTTNPTSAVQGSQLAAPSSPPSLRPVSRRQLFSHFPITPTNLEYFLLDYYVNYLAGVEHFHCLRFRDSNAFKIGMTKEWIPMALSDGGALSGVLIIPCRRMLERTGDEKYSRMALNYKISCIKSLKYDIESATSPIIGDVVISKALLLAADEIYYGDRQTCENHVHAVGRMVQLRGGFHTLGMNGFLGLMVDVFSRAVYAKLKLGPGW